MSTNASIAIKQKDGKVKSAYVHWDGYPEHTGQTLAKHYNTEELANKVIDGGDISSIDNSCEKPEGHTFDNPTPGHTIYYGRDRGEEGVEPKISESVSEWRSKHGQEYDYLFFDGEWHVALDGGFVPMKNYKEAE